MLSIMQKLTRPALPDTAPSEAAELLASCNLPNPEGLRQQLRAFETHRDADEIRCEQIQHDGRAFLEQQAIAERRPRLRAQIDALNSQIASAETRRAAFVALVGILDNLDQQIIQASQRLYADVLIASKDERRARLESLDRLQRLRARIAAPLAVVSPLRKFRRAPDPVVALTNDLRARADEIERALGPGMPRTMSAWPAHAQDLIEALKGGSA
jgi:hypothetical protein